VAHGHGDGSVRPLLGMEPDVGKLGDLRIVGRYRHGLGALVANLGEEMRVWRAGLGHIGAPRDDEACVVPIRRFRHVGLLAPDLWAGGRQVAVPVVEAHAYAADETEIAAPSGIAHHRHGGDRREADDPIGPMLLDSVDVGRGDDFIYLVPARAHETTEAAHRLVVAPSGIGLDDGSPGLDRPHARTRFAPALQQAPTH
jgi:hypothetical protein